MTQESDDRVCGALISGASMRVETHASLWLCGTVGIMSNHIIQPSGPYLDMGRNKYVRRFLNIPGHTNPGEFFDEEWLLNIDTDVQFTPDDMQKMVDAANEYHRDQGVYPIVCGAYQGIYNSQREAVAYRWNDQGWERGIRRKDLNTVPLAEINELDGVIPIDAAGTGFMLVHRSTLEKMRGKYPEPWPWFIETAMPNKKKWWRRALELLHLRESPIDVWFGEDLHFCFRAASMGHPILLHCGVKLVHYKELGLAFH